LISMLQDSQFYLTGNRAGATPTGSDIGMRVGFIRMGTNAVASPANVGSQGRLTGDWNEAMSDISFLGINPSADPKETRNIGTVATVARQMFGPSIGRKQVLVVITAGKLQDAAQAMANTGSDLYYLVNTMKVTIVGAALRTIQPMTWDAYAGQASLNIITNGNANAWVGATLADIPTSVVFGIC